MSIFEGQLQILKLSKLIYIYSLYSTKMGKVSLGLIGLSPLQKDRLIFAVIKGFQGLFTLTKSLL